MASTAATIITPNNVKGQPGSGDAGGAITVTGGLAGAGNYAGALLGGMLLGLVEQLSSLFLTTQVSEAVAYVLLVLVLLLRPTGLFGGRST